MAQRVFDSPTQLRARLLEVVSRNGGHLASSLGAVEIAMALADVFEPQKDRVVWDVGHQAYAWKLLTGRDGSFDTLRKLGGISGFPLPSESPCDAAVAGHAGVALSVATGFAAARDRRGTDEHVVAVVGDAAMCNGVSLEALSCLASSREKVIVVLNDNGVGMCSVAGLFERAGFRRIGPVDGHDLAALRAAFVEAKGEKLPVVVHALTRKGRGFGPAEADPAGWHAVGSFDLRSGEKPTPAVRTWSDAFGDAVRAVARRDGRVAALTAAMCDGTGLGGFAEEFPDRFFDVGIAEEHMVAFAAGLAAGGMRPVVAVYSTFLQRAVDQVMHDVCLPNLPVVFCVDRAGVVGADGATHQGVFDVAMLRCLPNLAICQPRDEDDMRRLLDEALERRGPTVIRYPKGAVAACAEPASAEDAKIALWVTGDWMSKANEVAHMLGGCEVVHARYLKPFDAERLAAQRARGMKIVSIENGCVAGGFGEAVGADMRFGWPDVFIPHGSQAELEAEFGLGAADIANTLRRVYG